MLALPVWITRKEYAFLEHYLVTKDITMIGKEVKDTALLIKLLRVSDYLNMSSFQQQLITDIIIPSLNDTNCISFIE